MSFEKIIGLFEPTGAHDTVDFSNSFCYGSFEQVPQSIAASFRVKKKFSNWDVGAFV
jgi:hypothetical protein